MLDQHIEALDQAVRSEGQRDKMALLLQTQPGVGPITALAYMLTMGDLSRFPRRKRVASYLGLIPRENCSGGRQKLGAENRFTVRCQSLWSSELLRHTNPVLRTGPDPCALTTPSFLSRATPSMDSNRAW